MECSLIDFSLVVGDASIASLRIFDMLSLEPLSDWFEVSVMLIRRLVQIVQSWAKSLYLLQSPTRIFDVLCFFQALAEALKTNRSVRDMNLESNWIGPEGAQARPVSDVLGSLA